jgi:hypothetical protein
LVCVWVGGGGGGGGGGVVLGGWEEGVEGLHGVEEGGAVLEAGCDGCGGGVDGAH